MTGIDIGGRCMRCGSHVNSTSGCPCATPVLVSPEVVGLPCLACGGSGVVSVPSYTFNQWAVFQGEMTLTCRQCNGTGLVWRQT